MSKLTPKQEGFCLSYIETGNASEAYRLNYSAENMSPESVFVNASRMLNNTKVALRLQQLKQHHQKRHDITVDRITRELYEDREAAKKVNQFSASIAALMHVAKLHGLVTDKSESKFTGTIIERVDFSNARKNTDTV